MGWRGHQMEQMEEVRRRGRSMEQVEVEELGRRRFHMEQVEEMRWSGQVEVEERGWRGEVEDFNLGEIYRILDLPESWTNKDERKEEEEERKEEEEDQGLLTSTGLSRLLEVAVELQQSLEGGGGEEEPLLPPAPPRGEELHQLPPPSWSQEWSPGGSRPGLDSSAGLLDWTPGLDSSVRSPASEPAMETRTPSVIQRTPSLPPSVSQ